MGLILRIIQPPADTGPCTLTPLPKARSTEKEGRRQGREIEARSFQDIWRRFFFFTLLYQQASTMLSPIHLHVSATIPALQEVLQPQPRACNFEQPKRQSQPRRVGPSRLFFWPGLHQQPHPTGTKSNSPEVCAFCQNGRSEQSANSCESSPGDRSSTRNHRSS